jgi:cytidylate kinase
MKVRVITIEREFGSGGAEIAKKLGRLLGWRVLDEELSQEIARVANVDPKAAKRCDERVDPFLYRLFKVYARGSYERSLQMGDSRSFDTDRMVALLHQVIEKAASQGECIVVGRGSPYILRKRTDAFHVFVYAPYKEKIRRLRAATGKSEKEAAELINSVDHDRASFIRRYFGKEWPYRPLYDLMINSCPGDDYVLSTIVEAVANLEKSAAAVPAGA